MGSKKDGRQVVDSNDLKWKRLDEELRAEAEANVFRAKPWTKQETELLIKYRGKINTKKIAEIMGRTYDSVHSKITTLYRK